MLNSMRNSGVGTQSDVDDKFSFSGISHGWEDNLVTKPKSFLSSSKFADQILNTARNSERLFYQLENLNLSNRGQLSHSKFPKTTADNPSKKIPRGNASSKIQPKDKENSLNIVNERILNFKNCLIDKSELLGNAFNRVNKDSSNVSQTKIRAITDLFEGGISDLKKKNGSSKKDGPFGDL